MWDFRLEVTNAVICRDLNSFLCFILICRISVVENINVTQFSIKMRGRLFYLFLVYVTALSVARTVWLLNTRLENMQKEVFVTWCKQYSGIFWVTEEPLRQDNGPTGRHLNQTRLIYEAGMLTTWPWYSVFEGVSKRREETVVVPPRAGCYCGLHWGCDRRKDTSQWILLTSAGLDTVGIYNVAEIISCFNRDSRVKPPCTLVTLSAGQWLTPWSRVLLDKLAVAQLVNKLSVFYGTQRIITVFTRARHSTHSHSIALCSFLRLGLSIGLFPSGFPIFFCMPTHFSSSHASCMPYSSHPPLSDHPKNIWWAV
jgi:hypothetical protein